MSEAHRAGWEKETTPTYPNMSPLYRGELTTCSLWKAAHMSGWEKETTPTKSEFATPLVEGNLPLIPLSGGVPEGRGGSKETTPTWLRMPPLCRGELTSYSSQ